MRQHVSSLLLQVAKLAFSGGLLWYMFHSGRIDLDSLKQLASPQMAALGFLLVGITLFLSSERWRVLLRQQELPTSMWLTAKLTLIGTFFNFFIPGGVGGDLVKAVLIARERPQQRAKVALTVLADRILGLFTMVTLALASFIFGIDTLEHERTAQVIFLFLVFALSGFGIGFWLLFSASAQGLRQKVERFVSRWHRIHVIWVAIQSYRLSWGEIVQIAALSLGAQIFQIFLFIAIANAMGPLPGLGVFFFAVPLGFMISAIPISPNGVGIGQAAFLYLFSTVLGHETNIGVLGVTAFQAYQLCYGVLGAVFFVLMRKKDPHLSMHELEQAVATAE